MRLQAWTARCGPAAPATAHWEAVSLRCRSALLRLRMPALAQALALAPAQAPELLKASVYLLVAQAPGLLLLPAQARERHCHCLMATLHWAGEHRAWDPLCPSAGT